MNKLTIIAAAVFFSVLLLSIDANKLAYAQAITTNYDFNFEGQRNNCDFMKAPLGLREGSLENHVYACISNGASASNHKFTTFTSNTNPPTSLDPPFPAPYQSFDVYPQRGGCSSPSNPCSSTSGSVSGGNNAENALGHSGRFGQLWCGITDCYTLWISKDSYSHQLIRISPNDMEVNGYMNFSNGFELRNGYMTGVDISRVGIGSINIYYLRCDSACSSTGVITLVLANGVTQMSVVSTSNLNMFWGDNGATNGFGPTGIDICWFCNGDTTDNTNNKLLVISTRQGVNTNRAVDVVRADLLTEVCGFSNSAGGYTDSDDSSITRILNATRLIYGTDANMYTVTLETCVKDKTVSYASLGITGPIFAIRTNTTQTEHGDDSRFIVHGGVFWIQHNNATTSSISQVNATTCNTLVNFDSTNGPTITNFIGQGPTGSLSVDPYAHTILRTDVGTKGQILFLSNFEEGSGGGGGPTTPAEDCEVDYNFDGEADVVFTDVGGPNGAPTIEDPDGGVPDGMCDGRPTQHLTAGQNTTESAGEILCMIGIFTDNDEDGICPDDEHIEALGLILIVVAFGIMVLMFALARLNTNMVIPEWLWITGTLIILGIGVALGWIDVIWLVTGIIVMAGFASLRFLKVFGDF